jgi:hypothetical protein
MRFAMEMKDRPCPPSLDGDRCLVFELLKGHFCLQDSAITWRLLDMVAIGRGILFLRGIYGDNQGTACAQLHSEPPQ